MSEKFSNESAVDVPADGVAKVTELPASSDLSPTYFVALRILDANGNIAGSNFYWLSTKPETVDWPRSNWYTRPTASYADFTSLAQLPKVKLKVTERSERKGEDEMTHVNPRKPHERPRLLLCDARWTKTRAEKKSFRRYGRTTTFLCCQVKSAKLRLRIEHLSWGQRHPMWK